MTEATAPPMRCATVEEFLARRQLAHSRHETPRCYGVSSDAIALFAAGYREEPTLGEFPADRSDLEACERTYAMAPEVLLGRMGPVLEKYRAHIAGKADYDKVTVQLRSDGWVPARDYPCGCTPSRLCARRAHQRAVDHYADPRAWR